MSLQNVFSCFSDQSFLTKEKNIILTSTIMPSVFCLLLLEKAKTLTLPAEYKKLSVTPDSYEQIKSALSMAFLGSSSWYWLGNISLERETKQSKLFLDFITNYTGPHWVCSFISSGSKQITGKNVLTLPQEIDFFTFQKLATFFSPKLDRKKITIAETLFKERNIGLDDACMLINYLELMNSKHTQENNDYLQVVFSSEKKLYDLSELFFEKNSSEFLLAWQQQYHHYPDVFWITFWTEQLWRAHGTIYYLKNKNFAQAKKISYRLPYSFLNNYWQKTQPHEITQAYEFLYTFDFALKNGSTFLGLDLFFTSYFSGKFND